MDGDETFISRQNKMASITFKFDRQKAIQVVLWFLARHGGKLNKLKLVKLVFFADREHLARYARPIIGGKYVAMPHGPVLSELLDLINSAAQTPQRSLEFSLEENTVKSSCGYDEEYLSESDIEALKFANEKFGSQDPFRLADFTHTLKAWSSNYPCPNENTSHPLPYEDFFLDMSDNEMLEIIKEDQEVREIFG